MASVYLIHLDRPIHHAKHYLGYTSLESVRERLQRHQAGNGARLLATANGLGISYKIVRVWNCNSWQTARALERQLKNQHNSPRLCPICNNGKDGNCNGN